VIRFPAASYAAVRKSLNQYGDAVQPELPRPSCTVMLVCGPPCAGKSRYVREHAREGDTVIDLDEIAKEQGFGRDRPADVAGQLLHDRNQRLAELAGKPRSHVAWVIIAAPSRQLREWWRNKLNARITLLVPSREVLLERAAADPERQGMLPLQQKLIDQWFDRELNSRSEVRERGR